MRQTGRIRARLASLARTPVLYVLGGAIWAVGLCGPAGAPPIPVAPSSRPSNLAEAVSLAASERSGWLHEAASRSAPLPTAPVDAAPLIVWPARGVLTGWFGEHRGSERHPGLDIGGPTGDPVVAATAGRVTVAGPAPAGYAGYGTVVMVDQGEGLVAIYAHLSRVAVRRGDEITPGQRIGAIGTTGNVTGSHLHFELRRRGVAVDPARWLPPR